MQRVERVKRVEWVERIERVDRTSTEERLWVRLCQAITQKTCSTQLTVPDAGDPRHH